MADCFTFALALTILAVTTNLNLLIIADGLAHHVYLDLLARAICAFLKLMNLD